MFTLFLSRKNVGYAKAAKGVASIAILSLNRYSNCKSIDYTVPVGFQVGDISHFDHVTAYNFFCCCAKCVLPEVKYSSLHLFARKILSTIAC